MKKTTTKSKLRARYYSLLGKHNQVVAELKAAKDESAQLSAELDGMTQRYEARTSDYRASQRQVNLMDKCAVEWKSRYYKERKLHNLSIRIFGGSIVAATLLVVLTSYL